MVDRVRISACTAMEDITLVSESVIKIEETLLLPYDCNMMDIKEEKDVLPGDFQSSQVKREIESDEELKPPLTVFVCADEEAEKNMFSDDSLYSHVKPETELKQMVSRVNEELSRSSPSVSQDPLCSGLQHQFEEGENLRFLTDRGVTAATSATIAASAALRRSSVLSLKQSDLLSAQAKALDAAAECIACQGRIMQDQHELYMEQMYLRRQRMERISLLKELQEEEKLKQEKLKYDILKKQLNESN